MTPAAEQCAIDIRGVAKKYGQTTALHDLTLQIYDNEFFTLLGPSGCGKTTLLRILAGFEAVNAGEIFLYGEEIEKLAPRRRPINTVFQNYALFPHITVFENVMFGLRMLKKERAAAEERARAMLSLVRLSALADRYPAQLSGGQQQRVALARALAPAPKVLLLDESLSALDLKLRQAMRLELKQIQRETGITFLFVTHDQEEALVMSDRIAILSEGRLQQVGDTREIYRNPANRFVADFIGETNLLSGEVDDGDPQRAFFVLAGGSRLLLPQRPPAAGRYVVSIRPEHIRLVGAAAADTLPARVERVGFIGAVTEVCARLRDGPALIARAQNDGETAPPEKGEVVHLSINHNAVRVLAE